MAGEAKGVIAVYLGLGMVFTIADVFRQRSMAVLTGEPFMITIRKGIETLFVFRHPLLVMTVGAGA